MVGSRCGRWPQFRPLPRPLLSDPCSAPRGLPVRFKVATTGKIAAMTHQDLPLGRHVDYPREYDASLLFPIARALGRGHIGIDDDALPFIGLDRWHAYELSWLDAHGKPHVGTATITVPATAPNLIESKSLKLYLNSFNSSRFDSDQAVRERMAADLTRAAGAPVDVA